MMRIFCLIFSVLLMAGGSLVAQEHYVIETVAGTGQSASNGAPGDPLKTNIGQPFGVVFGPDGALYIAEVQNHRIWRLDPLDKKLRVVAGNGKKGYSGDGGPATAASMNEPYEIRFDAEGNLYVVERLNHVVRRIAAGTGIIQTIAGSGSAGFEGDGGPAVKAKFDEPHSIAIDTDKNQLYIADIRNHRIRLVDLESGVIVTFAGNGTKQLPAEGQPASGPVFGPRALDLSGRIMWLALREGNSLWAIHLDRKQFLHVGGTGKKGFAGDGAAAKAALFNGPKGVAIRQNLNHGLYVVDTENQAIRMVRTEKIPGTEDLEWRVRTIAGTGPEGRGYNGDNKPANQAHLGRPHGICVGPDGSIYIGDSENHRVRVIRRVENF